jgi:hypothetical protein
VHGRAPATGPSPETPWSHERDCSDRDQHDPMPTTDTVGHLCAPQRRHQPPGGLGNVQQYPVYANWHNRLVAVRQSGETLAVGCGSRTLRWPTRSSPVRCYLTPVRARLWTVSRARVMCTCVLCTIDANNAAEALHALVNAALMAGENVTEHRPQGVLAIARPGRRPRSRRHSTERHRQDPTSRCSRAMARPVTS